MFIVYILKNRIAQKSYVGMTDNIIRRIKEHNAGKHFYTKRYLPWQIVHSESFPTFSEALQREKYLKTTSGRRILKKIFNEDINK